MSKIKIFYVSHSLQIGGAEVCLRTLVKSLDRDKYEPVVLFPKNAPPGPLRREIEALGIRTLTSPLEWWIRPSSEYVFRGQAMEDRITALVQILNDEQPQIVQTNTSVIWEGALAAARLGIPHIWHVHEILDQHPSLEPLLPLPLFYWMLQALSAQVVVVSQAARVTYEKTISSRKLTTIWNGLDWVHCPQSSIQNERLRSEMGFAQDAVIALAVGGLLPEKAYDVLLKAMALAVKGNVALRLVIAGAGKPSAIKTLKNQIQTNGLQKHVHYLGVRDDVPRLLEVSDFLVQASRIESFSLTIVEAMAAGKPVAATRSGGPSEIILDGITGLLAPIDDPQSLALQINQLAVSPEARKTMGAQAQRRFEQNFRADAYAKRFEALYQEVLSQPSAPDQKELAVAESLVKVYEQSLEQVLISEQLKSPMQWEIRKLRKKVGRAVLDGKAFLRNEPFTVAKTFPRKDDNQ